MERVAAVLMVFHPSPRHESISCEEPLPRSPATRNAGTFEAVSRNLSFTRAADELALTQSAAIRPADCQHRKRMPAQERDGWRAEPPDAP
jgi:Bacterial regulatory helix-turn-helix protein, lysR family